MSEKYDLKSIIVSLLVILAGVLLAVADIFLIRTDSRIWIGIGGSLLASGLVILLQTFLVNPRRANPMDEWGVEKMYTRRSEKNAESDPGLLKVSRQLDAVAFGLHSFRQKNTTRIERCLKRGVNIRILTMNPSSPFVAQREKEENQVEGQIANTIRQLVDWADDLNSRKYEGSITVKGYSCMTLDFYWRMDDDMYVGPYWYGIDSQQTVTYKFVKGKKAFSQYEEYFEKLWSDPNMVTLTGPRRRK